MAVAAAATGMWALKNPTTFSVSWFLGLVVAAHAIVTFNYIGGAVAWNKTAKMGPAGFRAYCISLACLWAILGAAFGRPIKIWRYRVVDPTGEESAFNTSLTTA